MDEVKKDTTTKEPNVNLFELKKKIYIGSDFSLSIGTQTYIYLAPMIGYDFTKRFSGGFSMMYQLLRVKYNTGAVVAENSFGIGTFLRYRPIPQIILHTEMDIFNTRDYSVALGGRVNVPAFMLGAGYAGNMGDRAYYSLLLMYDFIGNYNMPILPFFSFKGAPFYFRYGFVWHLG